MGTRIVEPITVIGLGCAGIRVLRELDELGSDRIGSNITLIDSDIVKGENIRSQLYTQWHVGEKMHKVHAAKSMMSQWSGLMMRALPEHVRSGDKVRGVVFLCVDSMDARKEIMHGCLFGNSDVPLVVDIRLESEAAHLYVIDPSNDLHQEQWNLYWYPDDMATTAGSCGAATSFGPIANAAANCAVWQLIRYREACAGSREPLDQHIRLKQRPLSIETYRW